MDFPKLDNKQAHTAPTQYCLKRTTECINYFYRTCSFFVGFGVWWGFFSVIPCKRLQAAVATPVILKISCISTPVCENPFQVRT